MPRIKGWEKIEKGDFGWRNKKGNFEILIYFYPLGLHTRYMVRIFKKYGKISMIYKSKNFKTKKQALKYAKAWMKKHPEG